MAVPIITQLFQAFLGEQEGIHSIILPDIFSSGGSKNLYIDKYGRAKKISGYEKQNGTAVTTDTGASATLLRSLFPYRSSLSGAFTRVLLGIFDDGTNEYELHTSGDTGATWTFRTDLGSTAVGKIPDFAQFGNEVYLAVGGLTPRSSADGTTWAALSPTQSPTPSAAESSTAGVVNGTRFYKLVSIEADGSRHAGSAASTAVNVQNKQVDLTWTADADTDVIGYELYSTTGTGVTFYFSTFIDGRVTASHTDNVSDLTLLENRVLEEHGDPPPSTYFCEAHKQRMWWARTDTSPRTAYYSDAGDADSVWAIGNKIDFSDAETMSDVITGMLGNFEGQLIVFTERAIWTVSGTGQVIGNIVDWSRTRTNAQLGSVSHRTAVRIPAGSTYTDAEGKKKVTEVVTVAYLTPHADIRLFDGDNDVIISTPVKNSLADVNYTHRHKCHALHDIERGQVIWLYPHDTATEPDRAVVWNYRWGVWYPWYPVPFAASCEADSASAPSILLTGSSSTTTGGYCYEFFTGNSFDGTAIESVWMTKTLFGTNENGQPIPSHLKRFRWLDLLFETDQTITLTVEWLPGYSPDNGSAVGTATTAVSTDTLFTSDGEEILSSDGETLGAGEDSTTVRVLLKASGDYLHDEGMRLRIKDNASSGSWSLEAFNLAYQILPGLQRRMQI